MVNSLANIRWTSDELDRLAFSNYEKHSAHIKLSGVVTHLITPFGLSQNPESVQLPAEEHDEFDFELAPDPFDDFLQLDVADELQQFDRGYGFGLEDIDMDVVDDRGDVSLLNTANAGEVVSFPRVGDGFEINYANFHKCGRFSFGISRKEFFYAQLRRMKPAFLENANKFSSYQIAATFSEKKDLTKYGVAVGKNFGTTAVNSERRIVPHNKEVWEFDIHDPLIGMIDKPLNTQTITGVLVPFDPVVGGAHVGGLDGYFENFVKQMTDSLDRAIPEESDSGSMEFAKTSTHMMNLFLYKTVRPEYFAGGKGLYDVSKDTSEKASFSHKSVFTPEVTLKNTCVWECVLYFLYLKHLNGMGGIKEGWYEKYVMYCLEKHDTTRNNKVAGVKREVKKMASDFRRDYFQMLGESVNVGKISLEDVPAILRHADIEDAPVVLNSDGDALIGVVDDVEQRRCENGQFTALWLDDHLHLILSYTGSLVVKKCRRCDARFSGITSLMTHLKGKKCMTCVCKDKGKTFDNESEWREHMKTREQTCPKYRMGLTMGGNLSNVSGEGKDVRFLNDARPNYYRDKKKAQDEFDRDWSAMRNYKESIYFDLESVVPMNAAGVSVFEHEVQSPYATGWISRTDAANGVDVTIRYGENCMEEFITYLDSLYETILQDEVELWARRASEGADADPIPRKTKGFENFSFRIRKSWDQHFKNRDSDGCSHCNEPLDSLHGYEVRDEKFHYFSRCAIRHYAKNTAQKNLEDNFNDNAPRIPIWAHNGGKYDWVFLHRYLMESGRLDDVATVRSSSKYFQLSYRCVFEFKDSLNFMMGSLDKLGKDFGVDTLKGLFPYRLLDSLDKINDVVQGEEEIRRKIPHEFFQVPEKLPGPMGLTVKRDMKEEEYVSFFEERGWVYDIRAETVKYLADDVKCLYGVVEKFREGWVKMPHSPELFKYCTIGQMCHSYFLEHYLEAGKYPCLDACEDAYIRRALYGGRTEVFQRKAPEGSRIHYVDVNSLYPYVMESRDLPCGDPVWHFRRDDPQLFQFTNSNLPVMTKIHAPDFFEDLQNRLNSGEENKDIYGFVEVDVNCGLDTVYPVLPERRSVDGGKTFKNMFTNMSKTKMVYYTEELKRAIANGSRVTKVWSYTEWQRGRVYGELIHVLKEQKLLGEGKDIDGKKIPGCPKNPSLRAAAKTAQNSLFGKTIQFIDSHVQLVHTRERLFRIIDSPFAKVSIKPTFRSDVSDVVEVTSKFVIPKIQKRSCAAIGTAILAEARLVLYDYFEMAMAVGGEILYCDTDSIVFAGDTPLPDSCMHDCEYGKMKVEIDPDTIHPGGFVGMSPKCYAFNLKDDVPYVRFKGVVMSENLNMPTESDPMNDLVEELECEEIIEKLGLPVKKDEVVVRGVNYDMMRKLIDGDVDALMTEQMQFRKTTVRTVSACKVVKIARSNFDKRMLGYEGRTFAWNDFNFNMATIVEEGNVRALSDYLGFVSLAELEVLKETYASSDFFNTIFSSWLDSDNVNAILYNFEKSEKIEPFMFLEE